MDLRFFKTCRLQNITRNGVLQECRDRTSSTTTTVTESTESTTTGSTESTTTGTTTTFTGGAGPTPSELNIMWLCPSLIHCFLIDENMVRYVWINMCAFLCVFRCTKCMMMIDDAGGKFPTTFWENLRDKYVSYASRWLCLCTSFTKLRSCQGTM